MVKVVKINFHPNVNTGRCKKSKVFPVDLLEGISYDEDTASFDVLIEGKPVFQDVSSVEFEKIEVT